MGYFVYGGCPAVSYLAHLECPRCSSRQDPDRLQNLCPCGSPLLARYDLDRARQELDRDRLRERPPTLWRYRELLPVRDPAQVVSLGEGMTPLYPVPRLGAALDLPDLWLKDEGVNPGGTFKSRGAAVGVSRARELGARVLALPTAGNAGAAWALYAARAGLGCVVVMPEDAEALPMRECALAGARTFLVRGLISDAGAVAARAALRYGWFEAATLKEPYRLEGKKTMGYEIAEQMGWRLPDAILYPTGGGVGIIGIYKALLEMEALGWIRRPFPRLVAVQAAGCAPIVQAFREGKDRAEFWPGAATVAGGIRVPKPLGDFLVLEAIRATGGTAVAVTDPEILAGIREAGRAEGVFLCPEGAALVAAARRLRQEGFLRREDRVVLLNTGTGLKYPETVPADLPVLDPEDDLPEVDLPEVGRP
ncbi:MAG: threonine synthase [Firmicutes bacterium]|nr:threonine synthase [Bacillota bacterium]